MGENIKCMKFNEYGSSSDALIVPFDINGFNAIKELCFGNEPYDEYVGEKYQFEIIEMTQEELDNLQEWDGF